jgi:HK97 family phage prohead protease
VKKLKNKELERRSYSFEVRAEQGERGSRITGRPIVYNSRTDIAGLFDEIIEEGALNGADLRDVRFLVNHDLSKIPLARSRNNNGNSTMQLRVDSAGMEIDVDLDTENNADARALYSAVSRGDITGMSFMFGVDDESWENIETDHPTRRIKAISSVVEVSAVTFPAYAATSINARSEEALESAKAALENAKQQRAASLDSEDEDKKKKELELLKLKIQILGGK